MVILGLKEGNEIVEVTLIFGLLPSKDLGRFASAFDVALVADSRALG